MALAALSLSSSGFNLDTKAQLIAPQTSFSSRIESTHESSPSKRSHITAVLGFGQPTWGTTACFLTSLPSGMASRGFAMDWCCLPTAFVHVGCSLFRFRHQSNLTHFFLIVPWIYSFLHSTLVISVRFSKKREKCIYLKQ